MCVCVSEHTSFHKQKKVKHFLAPLKTIKSYEIARPQRIEKKTTTTEEEEKQPIRMKSSVSLFTLANFVSKRNSVSEILRAQKETRAIWVCAR